MDDEFNNVPAATALIISHRSTRMSVRHDPKETELQRQKSSADLTSTFLKNSEIFKDFFLLKQQNGAASFHCCQHSLLVADNEKRSLCLEEMWPLFVIKQLIIPAVVVSDI